MLLHIQHYVLLSAVVSTACTDGTSRSSIAPFWSQSLCSLSPAPLLPLARSFASGRLSPALVTHLLAQACSGCVGGTVHGSCELVCSLREPCGSSLPLLYGQSTPTRALQNTRRSSAQTTRRGLRPKPLLSDRLKSLRRSTLNRRGRRLTRTSSSLGRLWARCLMPPKRNARRADDAPASAPPAPAKKARVAPEAAPLPARRSRSAAVLDEDELAANAGSSPAELADLKRVQDLSFWSQFATALIFIWIMDFTQAKKNKHIKQNQHDREYILQFAASHAWVVRPKAGVELQELQACYVRVVPPQERDTLPGLFMAPPPAVEAASSSAAAAAPAPPAAGRAPQAKLPPSATRALSMGESAAIKIRKRPQAASFFSIPADVDDDDVADDEDEPEVLGHSARPAPAAASSSASAHGPAQCPHCLQPAPTGRPDRFACAHCARRSDLEFGDERNTFLVGLAAQKASAHAASAPSPASATTTSGQSSSDTASSRSLLIGSEKLLEQEYQRMIIDHPTNPFFGKGAPPISAVAAMAANYKALKASSFHRPPPALLQVIREGKLRSVGYALPRPISSAASADNATLSFDASGLSVKQKSAPKIERLEQFCQALFCTILPALANDPSGIIQWITLGRTVLALSEANGWSAAASYLEQLLNERVYASEGFCDVSHSVLTTVTMAQGRNGGSAAGGAPRPPQQVQSVASGRSRIPGVGGTQVCFDWNKGNCPRGKPACNYLHQCSSCSSTTHNVSACPLAPPRATCASGGKPKRPESVHTSTTTSKAKDGNGSE